MYINFVLLASTFPYFNLLDKDLLRLISYNQMSHLLLTLISKKELSHSTYLWRPKLFEYLDILAEASMLFFFCTVHTKTRQYRCIILTLVLKAYVKLIFTTDLPFYMRAKRKINLAVSIILQGFQDSK